jgi:tetratricopeptide (TPR) repeat protein
VALEHARAAAAVMPDSPAVQYTLGQALEQHGDVEEAASHYRAAIERFSPADHGFRHVRLGHAHHRLGVVLARAGRSDDAIAAHKRALEYAPEDPDIHTDLAMVLAQTRNFDGAITHFETAVRHRQNSAALNNLAAAHLQAGHFDEAVQWLEQAVSLDPQLVDGFYNLGTAFSRLGRWTEAISAYQRVVTLAGPSADLLARIEFARAALRGGSGPG